jgi:hypothetical protein
MFRIKASQKHPYKIQLQLVGQEALNTGILLRFHLCFNNGLYAMWHSPEVFEKVPAGQSVQLELPAIFNPNIMFMRELAMLITLGVRVVEQNETETDTVSFCSTTRQETDYQVQCDEVGL